MKAKKFDNKYIVRLERGEEIIETLKQFCKDKDIKLGIIHGLGVAEKAEIGLYDVENKKYHSREFQGDYEISSFYGNVSTMAGETYLHCHINICDSELRSFGGHANSVVISATFEGVIDVIDGEVVREFDNEIGLNLLKL